MPTPDVIFGERIDPTVLESQLYDASCMPITASPGEGVVAMFGLNPPFNGKKTLDVAAGCASTSAWLREQGADAHAVDIGYDDVEGMMKKSRTYWRDEVLTMHSMALAAAADPGIANSHEADLATFIDDFIANRDRYVTGSITELPFDNDAFDNVLCSSFLTEGTIGQQRQLVFTGLSEMLRVTRRSGSVRIGMLLGVGSRFPGVIEARKAISANLGDFATAAKQAKVLRKMGRFTVQAPGMQPAEYFSFEKR